MRARCRSTAWTRRSCRGCNCEDEPQTTEYDYVPLPTVTSVSTGTPADLPANAADLASEYGGAPSNVVTVTGTGLDPLTLSYATLGLPLSENSVFFPVQESGTSMVLVAPAMPRPGRRPPSLSGYPSAPRPWQARRPPRPTSTTPASRGHLGGEQATGKNGVPELQTCPSPPPAEAAAHR